MMNVHEMMDCMSMMGPMGWGVGLLWLLLLGLLIWGLYQLFRVGGAVTEGWAPSREPPLEALRRRYAEGAITTKEYEERKQLLSE